MKENKKMCMYPNLKRKLEYVKLIIILSVCTCMTKCKNLCRSQRLEDKNAPGFSDYFDVYIHIDILLVQLGDRH